MEITLMMKKTAVTIIITLIALPLFAQTRQETGLKREITLYNPYKPALPDVVKKSFLPDMTDTSRVRPDFSYEVKTYPFMPPYTLSPIKAAAMLPDPLPKLYNSFVKFGFGNHITPLAEVSISNQRSKKGNIGFYARHFSTNDDIQLEDLKNAHAGYMDNEAMLYGRKLMRKSVFEGSIDFIQKTRYAYGYDTAFTDYVPENKDIRLNYYEAGAKIDISSLKLDSSDLAYDFGLDYHYFFTDGLYNQHSFEFAGEMAKMYKGFYIGAGADFGYYAPSDSVSDSPRYIAALNPFVKRSSSEWDVKLGFQFLADKGIDEDTKIHLYPDLYFGFNIVPAYVRFFAELSGRLEKNHPSDVILMNPFILPGKQIYNLKNTDYSMVATAGLTGETGFNGRYTLSGSYSAVNDLLLFSNYILASGGEIHSRGNYFKPVYDQSEIFNAHGDMSGNINEEISFEAGANYYNYSLASNEFAWNKPDWDARLGVHYNLRNKIIAGIGVNAIGKRMGLVTEWDQDAVTDPSYTKIKLPSTINFNLSGEYRYTKILSFWLKFNNISFSKHYEWVYYPSQRFFFQLGFTYSL